MRCRRHAFVGTHVHSGPQKNVFDGGLFGIPFFDGHGHGERFEIALLGRAKGRPLLLLMMMMLLLLSLSMVLHHRCGRITMITNGKGACSYTTNRTANARALTGGEPSRQGDHHGRRRRRRRRVVIDDRETETARERERDRNAIIGDHSQQVHRRRLLCGFCLLLHAWYVSISRSSSSHASIHGATFTPAR